MTLPTRLGWVLGLLLASCASTGDMAPTEKRNAQTRPFERATYESAFRAFKAIFQDDGYIIKSQDPRTGVIIATLQRTSAGREAVWKGFGAASEAIAVGDTVEVVVNLVKTAPGIGVESRLTVQKIEQYAVGGQQGVELETPEIYSHLFRKVALELERRRPSGKP